MFNEMIQIANNNLTNALYEWHFLMSIRQMLMDSVPRQTMWFVEMFNIPLRENFQGNFDQTGKTPRRCWVFSPKQEPPLVILLKPHWLNHRKFNGHHSRSIWTPTQIFPSPHIFLVWKITRVGRLTTRSCITQAPSWSLLSFVLISIFPSFSSPPVTDNVMARELVVKAISGYVLEISPDIDELISMAMVLFFRLQNTRKRPRGHLLNQRARRAQHSNPAPCHRSSTLLLQIVVLELEFHIHAVRIRRPFGNTSKNN